jgi:hypothetical protein
LADGDILTAFGVITVRLALLFFAAGVAGAQEISTAADNQPPLKPLQVEPVGPDTLHFEARMIPDFEAKDITGRLWRSADLRGKLTVIDIWGTFGGVQNQEHPELQRFTKKLRTARAFRYSRSALTTTTPTLPSI